MNPTCPDHPEHGEMSIEPMYGAGMIIIEYGYFCQANGCEGYGGPVPKERAPRIPKPKTEQIEQLSFFQEEKPS